MKYLDDQREINQHFQDEIEGLLIRVRALEFYLVSLHHLAGGDANKTKDEKTMLLRLARKNASGILPDAPDRFIEVFESLIALPDSPSNIVQLFEGKDEEK